MRGTWFRDVGTLIRIEHLEVSGGVHSIVGKAKMETTKCSNIIEEIIM